MADKITAIASTYRQSSNHNRHNHYLALIECVVQPKVPDIEPIHVYRGIQGLEGNAESTFRILCEASHRSVDEYSL
jgi:hypothetical protein